MKEKGERGKVGKIGERREKREEMDKIIGREEGRGVERRKEMNLNRICVNSFFFPPISQEW